MGVFREGPRDEITLRVGGPKPHGWCPYTTKRDAVTEEKPRRGRGTDGRDTATSPGTPGGLRGSTRQTLLFPGTLEVVDPADTSISHFWFSGLWQNTFPVAKATTSVLGFF